MDTRTKKMVVILVCVIITAVSIVIRIHRKDDGSITGITGESTTESQAPATDGLQEETKEAGTSPESVEKEEPVTFGDSVVVDEQVSEAPDYYVYFTNTEKINKYNFMPQEAAQSLISETQAFLEKENIEGITELYVMDAVDPNAFFAKFRVKSPQTGFEFVIFYDKLSEQYEFRLDDDYAKEQT